MAERRSPLRLGAKPPPLHWGLLATIAVVAASTGLVYPLKTVAPAVSLGVVYIPGVLAIAAIWGLRLGLLCALLSALAFNFFHIPPVGRFTIAADRDLVAFVVFVIVALACGTLADLARARTAEAERRRQEADRALAEIEELARERDRMREETIEAAALRRSDELKTALLRAVSHDLRTPLTSMIAAGAALDSPSVSGEERHELSEAVVEQGQRLSRLVENLLDVSRLESGKAEPHREPVDLLGLLEAARHSLGARGEVVRLALDAELPALSADPTQLERAFANLLENAVVHGEGRPVLVRSRVVGPRVVVRSSTAGPGSRRTSAGGSLSPSTGSAAGARVGAPGSDWRSPVASSRPTAARSRWSRCPGRDRASSSASPPPPMPRALRWARRRARGERGPADPRLRRRAADPAGAARDPPRRRL